MTRISAQQLCSDRSFCDLCSALQAALLQVCARTVSANRLGLRHQRGVRAGQGLGAGPKHCGSRLPDAYFEIAIDDEKRLVVVRTQPFDSALLADVVTVVLPMDYEVIAFDDDNLPFQRRAPYRLEVRFDDLTFDAVVTRTLAIVSPGVSVGLHQRKPC